MSITSHLTNKHKFDDNEQYKACLHGELEATEEKPWLNEDSLVDIFSENYSSLNLFEIQAISKVTAAIRGHNNCRLEDLSMMTS